MFNFRNYYFNLRMEERARIKKEILEKTEISETSFYRIVNGSLIPKNPVKIIINQITKQDIYGKF